MILFRKKLPLKEEIKLNYSYDEKCIYFRIEGLPSELPAEEWLINLLEGLDAWGENRRMVLSQLAEQGLAEPAGSIVCIECRSLFKAFYEDILSLRLAEPYRMGIRINAKGIMHESAFRYDYEYVDGAGRVIVGLRRVGCFLEYGSEKRYLLSASQFKLLSEIDLFNARHPDEKKYYNNLLRFAEIKGLAVEIGAEMDRYLNNEEVVAAKEVSIEVRYIDEDTIEVFPVIEGVPKENFKKAVDNFQQVQEVYVLPAEGNSRLRIVPSQKAQLGIKEIKSVRRLKGRAKEDFIKRPQDFIDPEVIDLGCYSQRVIDIGEYKPRFFPFINPASTQWLPDNAIHTADPSKVREDKTPVETITDLESLESAYAIARECGESHFTWGGHVLPVDGDTEENIQRLRESFDTKGQKEGKQVNADGKTGHEAKDNTKKVLLINEHIDDADSSTGQTRMPFMAVKPVLPDNLLPGADLLGHQKEGLGWLQALYQNKPAGGLLADDMGLGKTLQILAFVSWYINNKGGKPVLIAAPVTLLENWAEEYEKFFEKTVEILPLHGDRLKEYKIKKKRSGREYDGEPRILLNIKMIVKYEIVLTTYETVRDYQFSFGKINWGIVITDESQKIKTPGTLVTTALKALKADFCIACTATPVENSLVDLWCILDFAKPGILGSLKEFLRKYDYPLRKKTGDRDDLVNGLRKEMDPFFMRRIKKDILQELPEKNVVSVTVPLGGAQLEQYVAVVNAYKLLDGEKRRGAILKTLLQLRDISAYPDISEDQVSYLGIEKIYCDCPKILKLVELLDIIKAKGEKAIIFTEHRRIQRILASILRRRYGFKPHIVNGEVAGSSTGKGCSSPTRKRMVDDFQAKIGFNIIIMSPLAAGFGLNIVEANHVIHYTRLWNPAKEDQATDRVYRIGQSKPVYVYYLISTDAEKRFISFDQRLDELLSSKRSLATDFLYPSTFKEVSKEELADIIKIENDQSKRKLALADIDKYTPRLFEAAIAALYELAGYETHLTPGSGDYGVDVVCLPHSVSGKGLIIQCKHAAGENAEIASAGEISSAVNLYADKYLTSFEPVVVTNRYFNKQAETEAKSNNMRLINRHGLGEMIEENNLTLDLIYRKEEERMKKI